MRRIGLGGFALLLLPLTLQAAGTEEISLLRSDQSGLEAEVRFPSPTVLPSETDPGYHEIAMGRISSSGEPGEPELPQIGFWVAVPPGANVSVSAVGSDELAWDDIRPLPAVTQEWVEVDPAEPPKAIVSLEEDPRIYAGGTFPRALAEGGPVSHLRHLRVIPVSVRPARWNPSTGRLTIAQTVRVSVRFEAGPTPTGEDRLLREDRSWEQLYERTVLNADLARQWLRRPAAAMRRPPTIDTTDRVKFEIRHSGLKRVRSEDLGAIDWDGFGSPLDDLRLYEIFVNSDDLADSMTTEVEVPISFSDADGSGTWTAGDVLYFYGQNLYDRLPDAPAYLSRYGRTHVYWLGLRPGGENARMESTSSYLGTDPGLVGSYPWTAHYEEEVNAYAKVGANTSQRKIDHESDIQGGVASVFSKHSYWQGGEPFSRTYGETWYSVPFDLPGFVAPRSLAARFQGIFSAPRYVSDNIVTLYLSNGAERDTVRFPENPLVFDPQDSALYVVDAQDLGGLPLAETNNYFVHLESPNGYGAALHWLEVGYDRAPKFFEDRIEIATGDRTGESEFAVQKAPIDPIVGIEFSDPRDPRRLSIDPGVQIVQSGPNRTLRLQWDLDGEDRRFALGTDASIPGPDAITLDTPSDLAGTGDEDYVVIVPRVWIPNIQPLVDHRESAEGGNHRVLVAAIEDVYDEFSGGRRWSHAIRSFLRTLFRTRAVPPAYLLLVGDATDAFDNNLLSSDPNWVPTQTMFSGSYTGNQGPELVSSDQWFVDNLVGTGERLDFLPDMHVGRLPAGDTDQLDAMVAKMIAYESFGADEQWRNRCLLIADDNWSSTITFDASYTCKDIEWIFRDSEEQARDSIIPQGRLGDFVVDTFFVTAYMDTVVSLGRCVIDEDTGKCLIGPNGDIVCNPDPPDDAFLINLEYGQEYVAPVLWQMMTRGYLYVAYNGHANARLMTHEYVFRHSEGTSRLDVDRVGNVDRPFLYMGYGCHLAEFSAFNEGNYGKSDGISENLLFADGRGGIGAIASTGYEWLNTTDQYDHAVTKAFFENPPQHEGHTRWVLGEIFSQSKAIMLGNAYSAGRQSMSATYTLLGDPGLIMDAAPPKLSITLDGEPVESGANLILPADRDSILLEAVVRDEVWARSFTIQDLGGTVPEDRYTVVADSADDRGLSVSYMTTIYPRSYDITLSAEDASGRISSASFFVRLGTEFEIRRPGSDWTVLTEGALVVAEDSVRVTVDSPRLLAAEDLALQLDGLMMVTRAEGSGEMVDERARSWTLTALEGIGKQSDRTLALTVAQPDGSTYEVTRGIKTEEAFGITDVYNVPNPFDQGTWIFYGIGARADEVTVRIFTSSGKRIKTLRLFGVPPHAAQDADYSIHWDGTDEDGDAVGNGLYFYKLTVQNEAGKVSKIEKMVRVR